MPTQEHLLSSMQSRISLALLVIPGVLFILKYSSRVIAYPETAALGYVGAVGLALFVFAFFRANLAERITPRQVQIALLILSVLMCIAMQFAPTDTRTTRFAALNEWWDDVLAGNYPYNHVGGASGFTGLFLMALPFRLLGNYGYMEVAGFLIFGLLAVEFAKTSTEALLQLTMLFFLPTFYYELVVRSEVLFNMSLCLALIFTAEKFGIHASNRLRFVLFALAFGLVLSTRSIVAVIYAIHLLFLFRERLGELIAFSLIVGSVFVISLAPLVAWNPEGFFQYGPFAIQLSYLPTWVSLMFVAISCVAGWKARHLQDVFFFTGCLLFVMTAASLLFRISQFGWEQSLYRDEFDISYFAFCTPFLLLSLAFSNSAQRRIS